MAIKYLDFEGGNDANDGTSFAQRWKTVTSGATAARTAPGDVIRVMGSPAPTSLGMTATWTNKSSTVTLNSALNVLITNCDSTFTGSANVTATAGTTYFRTGTAAASLDIAGAFGTGKVAYFATGTLDLSAYQGITLWVMVRTNPLAASTLSIRLCSDTIGAVTVDTLVIPAIAIAECWVPVYIDKGSALGASIQSIALYADADPGTIIVYLDNINTTKAAGNDCLSHRTLIGKNTTDELWWCIREINGTTLSLDGTPFNQFGSNQRVGRGYWGTSEAVTTYIRDVIQVAQTTGSFAVVQESGSAGNLISYLGGWNRTDMSTQTLETWVDGSGAQGLFWHMNLKDFIHMDLIHGVRWDTGLYHESNGLGCTFGTVKMGHCRTHGIQFRQGGVASATEMTGYGGSVTISSFIPSGVTITKLRSISAGLSGSVTFGVSFTQWVLATVTTVEIRNAAWVGFIPGTSGTMAQCTFGTITVSDCGNAGVILGASGCSIQNMRIGTITSSNNSSSGASLANVNGRITIDTMTLTSNGTDGLVVNVAKGGHVIIGSLTTTGNVGASGITLGGIDGIVEILASSIAEVTKVGASSASTDSNPYGRLTLRNYLGGAGDHRSWIGGMGAHGTLFSEASVRHTASGLAWRVSPLHAFIDVNMPLRVPLATIYVNASALVTVDLWMRRTNTGVIGTLFCRGGQLAGVASDVSDTITAAIDTWEKQTITFTPSEAGVIELEVQAYGGGGTHHLYFDDFSAVQA